MIFCCGFQDRSMSVRIEVDLVYYSSLPNFLGKILNWIQLQFKNNTSSWLNQLYVIWKTSIDRCKNIVDYPSTVRD